MLFVEHSRSIYKSDTGDVYLETEGQNVPGLPASKPCRAGDGEVSAAAGHIGLPELQAKGGHVSLDGDGEVGDGRDHRNVQTVGAHNA